MIYALKFTLTLTLLFLTSLPLYPYVCDAAAKHLPVWEPVARALGGSAVGISVIFAIYGIGHISPTAAGLLLWAGGGGGAAWVIDTYLT
jgi:hypothetical protein